MSIFNWLKFKKRSKVTEADAIRIARSVAAKYDSLKSRQDRPARKILADLSRTEQSFKGIDRIFGYYDADQLYDNDAIGSTLDTCIRLTIGQQGGYPSFKNEDVQKKFDNWKRDCGWQEGEHWHDLLKLILRTVKLHGDCLILLDPGLTENKLRIWDADQICSIGDSDFATQCHENGWYDGEEIEENQWRQIEGVVTDSYGRVKGWYVTSLRNRFIVDGDMATFIPFGVGRLVKSPKYLTQYRGEPVFLANAELTADTRSLIKSEVCASAISSQMPLVVSMPEGNQAKLSAAMNGLTLDQMVEGTDVSKEEIEELTQIAIGEKTFKAYKDLAAIAMVPHGTEVQNLATDRPSAEIREWMDALADENGKRMGVMSCLSRGRADNSYSSGQIELEISWASFQDDQKMLERQVVDYVCSILYPGTPYVVTWPRVMEIDPEKSQKTLDAELQGGRKTYREVLGPKWEEKLIQLSKEKKLLEKLGLTNLSFFQGKSGGLLLAAPEQEDIDG